MTDKLSTVPEDVTYSLINPTALLSVVALPGGTSAAAITRGPSGRLWLLASTQVDSLEQNVAWLSHLTAAPFV